jgi:hypothetical protein
MALIFYASGIITTYVYDLPIEEKIFKKKAIEPLIIQPLLILPNN